MLTDFVVASPDEASTVSSSSSRHLTWPCFQANGLDNSVVAALWSALDPTADASSLEGEACLVFQAAKEGPWVFNLPTPLVAGLASLPPESLLAVADRWVAQPELVHAGWQGSDVAPAIKALKGIASTAVQQNSALLLWMSL